MKITEPDHLFLPDANPAIKVGFATDRGKVREENEDALYLDPEHGLFILSDGMGGHRGGKLASQIIVQDLPPLIENKLHKLKKGNPRTIRRLLKDSIIAQNRWLYLEADSESGQKGMGATLVIALLWKGRLYIANVGDSRAYLYRGGKLKQLSQDHTVISELIEKGRLKPENADEHPAQGQLVHFMGMDSHPAPHVCSISPVRNDIILLCSDGLTDMLDEKQIEAVICENDDHQKCAEKLKNLANSAGGYDNITVILFGVRSAPAKTKS